MHILYLLTDLNGAGAALPVPDLVRVMTDEGHTVSVVALLPRDRKACARFDRAGIPWRLLSEDVTDTLTLSRALLKVIDDEHPDLLWTSLTRATVYGAIAGQMRRIPVVSWQHNTWLKWSNRVLLRLVRSMIAFWVADSHTVADFASKSLRIPAAKVEVWPLFRARAEAPVATACQPGERFRIGSLGRLHIDKNYCHLIEAAALIRERDPELAARIEIVIGGQGGGHAALAAQIADARLDNVRLVGFIDCPDAFLATLHAYVQPSHHEGLGIAAHEAMQAALPVVVTRVGEMQHSVLHGETGALFEVGDVSALADALMALARDPQRAAALGTAGRMRVLTRFCEASFRSAGRAVLARAAGTDGPGQRDRQLS